MPATRRPATSILVKNLKRVGSSGSFCMRRGLCITMVAFAATCSGAISQEAYAPLSAEAAQRRLETYVETWSSNREINPTNVGHYYADRVIYYGKPMSRQQV